MTEALHMGLRMLCILGWAGMELVWIVPEETDRKRFAVRLPGAVCLCLLFLLCEPDCADRRHIAMDIFCQLDNLFYANLLLAVLWDTECCLVYRFVWVAGGAGLLAKSLLLGWNTAAWASLLLYALFQEGIGKSFYGKADAHCFLVCGAYLVQHGETWEEPFFVYVLHMGISFLLLAAVNGVLHNLTSAGNLKRPVAFVPYIALGCCLTNIIR